MITFQNVGKHELIGLYGYIEDASNKSNIGVKGKVIDETMKTLTFDVDGERKKIQKKGTKFSFTLPSKKKVLLDGDKLVARPADRIKKKIKKW